MKCTHTFNRYQLWSFYSIYLQYYSIFNFNFICNTACLVFVIQLYHFFLFLGLVTSKIIKRNTHTQNTWSSGGRVHSSPSFIRDSFASATEPYFRSKPITFRVEQDKSVTLPCLVDNLGKNKHRPLRLVPSRIYLG